MVKDVLKLSTTSYCKRKAGATKAHVALRAREKGLAKMILPLRKRA
jgi:hypothetical protein